MTASQGRVIQIRREHSANDQFDHAAAAFAVLMYAPGLLAEAREHSGHHDMNRERAVGYIISQRWPDLRERDAYAAAARRYDVELPQIVALDADCEPLPTSIGPLSFSCLLEDTRDIAELARIALERYGVDETT